MFTGDTAGPSGCRRGCGAGTVWVNCFFVRDLRAPFGGAGLSGIGREGGTWSFDFYADVKNTVYAGQGWQRWVTAMGEVAGAGLLAHVPTIMLPYEQRLELNEGKEISLVPGLERLRAEVFETLDYDTVVVLDSHWHTTVEFVVAAQRDAGRAVHLRRAAARDVPDPLRLARRPRARPRDRRARRRARHLDHRHRRPVPALHYATVNLWHYLGRGLGKRWISVEHRADRRHRGLPARGPGARRGHRRRPTGRCCCWRPGRMSHTFWSLRELRAHEASDTAHIRTGGGARGRPERIAWLQAGDHARVIDTMPEFLACPARGQVRALPDDDRRPWARAR